MKIEISTEFETSYTEQYRTKIIARIVNDKGVILCEGADEDYWRGVDEGLKRASAKNATANALNKLEQLLTNARDVAKKSGLV